jgi:putative ubiquitin-RnfH superfamily antitoxin RatB of RatAB toxin-antitoxin module
MGRIVDQSMVDSSIHVQVCYATPAFEFLRDLQVAVGTTLEQAIAHSGLLQQVDGIDLTLCAVGIYGKKKTLDTVLREHDRIEVYRSLIADPKEARRRRAGSKVAGL